MWSSLLVSAALVALVAGSSSHHNNMAAAVLDAEAAAAAADAANADASCNIVREAEHYVHYIQAGDFESLQAMYHRNAIFYINGELAPHTGGRPLSVDQWLCVADRVHVTYEVTHFTRDWTHRTVSIAFKVTYDAQQALDVLVNLEFDRHTCQVQNENYFHATAVPSYEHFISQVADTCFADDLVASNNGGNNVAVFKACWRYLEREDYSLFSRCFDSRRTLWITNGVNTSATNNDPAFWMAVFNAIDFRNLVFHNVVQDKNAGTVSAVVSYDYFIKAEGDDAKAHHVTLGHLATYIASGVLTRLEQVSDDGETAAGYRAAFGDGATPAPAADDVITSTSGRSALAEIRALFGEPDAVTPLAAQWYPDDSVTIRQTQVLECLALVEVTAEVLAATPVTASDQALHYEHVVIGIALDVPGAKVADIQLVGRSVLYNRVDQMLYVRGESMGAAVATAFLVSRVASGDLTAEAARAALGDAIRASVRLNAMGGYLINPDNGKWQYSADMVTMASAVCEYAAANPVAM